MYPICVFLEKLKSMIQQHAYKTGLNLTCWFYEKGKKFAVFKCPHTPHWNLTQSWKYHIESKECMLLWKIHLPVLPLMFRNWPQSGCRVAVAIPGNCLSCWLILFASPVGSVNRFFLGSVGLAVVIVCIILRPEREWSWPCLIFLLKRQVCIIKFGITRRLRARTAGRSTPPRRCRRCPAPAPPQGQATRAVTASCVGFAGPWTPAIWGM